MTLGMLVGLKSMLVGVGVHLIIVDGMTLGTTHGIMVIMVVILIIAIMVVIHIMATTAVIHTIMVMLTMVGTTHGADIMAFMVVIVTMVIEEVATMLTMVIRVQLITGVTLQETLVLKQEVVPMTTDAHLTQIVVAM